MDDEQSLQSLPPEQQTADQESETTQATHAPAAPAAPAAETELAQPEAEAEAHAEAQAATESESDTEIEAAQGNGQPRGSISSVGERLGQRVAQVSEAAGDKVAHAGEVAGERVHHASEVAGERVAHVGEAAGQKVILASEAAEGTVAEAQTRAVQAKKRIAEQVGHVTRRIRSSAPTPIRENSERVVEAVRKNPRKAFAGSALVGGIMAAVRRRGRHSDDDNGNS